MDMGKFLASNKASLRDQVDEGIFFFFYMLHEKTKPAFVHPTRTALVLELIITFIHFGGYLLGAEANYGAFTQSWGQIVVYLQIRLLTFSSSYSPYFFIVFWIITALALVVLSLGVFLSVTFNRGLFRFSWMLNILNLAVFVFLNFFFITFQSVLLSPLFCIPETQTLVNYKQIDCFSDVPSTVVGIFLSLLCILFSILYTLTSVELTLISNSLLATTMPFFKLALFVAKLMFVLQGDYMGEAINGRWWQFFVYCGLLVLLFALLLYRLPFQNHVSNYGFAFVLGALNWIAYCAFLSLKMGPNPLKQNRALDFVLALGILPAGGLGVYLINLRIRYVQKITEFLHLYYLELLHGHDFDEHTTEDKDTEQSPKLIAESFLMDIRLKPYTSSILHNELLGRFLIQNKYYTTAEVWYRAALLIHPTSAFVHILYFHFSEFHKKLQASVDTEQVDVVEITSEIINSTQPKWYLRYYVFRMKIEADKNMSSSAASSLGHRLDLLQYVEFNKSFQTAKKYHGECIDSIQRFWLLFLGTHVSFEKFKSAVRKINEKTTLAELFYNTLLSRYPKSPKVLHAYSSFASLVLNDAFTAENYRQLALNVQARELEMKKENAGLGGDKTTPLTENAVITIDMDGLIQEVNTACIHLFGYTTKNELLQRKVNMLIPFPYKRFHSAYLQRFKKTGDKKVIGTKRTVYGLHKDGHAFLIELNIVEMKKRDKLYAGLISPCTEDSQKAHLCIDKVGIVQFIDKAGCDMFGYSPLELVEKNVKMIMPKEYESQHDSFLRRYLDTGDAKVIGMGVRNVKGMHKSGKYFAIGLEVTKEIINGEIYYFGTLVNMDDLVGEILINVHGEIRNCNDAASMILGYQRSELRGRNVKMLMPEPYNSYHDRYLERYRKTRKTIIVNNEAGRQVMVRNKAGMCFPVHLHVIRLENATEVLFRGTLRKVSSDLNEIEKEAAKSNTIVIDSKYLIRECGTNITTILETTSAHLLDKSIEQIFPPYFAIPHQEDIKTFVQYLLSSPEHYHFAYFVRKNRKLYPCAVKAHTEADGMIVIRMEEVLPKEGIIRIDEKGSVLECNEAIKYLFGYNQEEVLGKNLKMLMPPDISMDHDMYLKRYLETKVKTVIGISRSVKGLHKDEVTIALVIEVVELISNNERNFVGRVRYGDVTPQKLDLELYRKIMGIKNATSTVEPTLATPVPNIELSASSTEEQQRLIPSIQGTSTMKSVRPPDSRVYDGMMEAGKSPPTSAAHIRINDNSNSSSISRAKSPRRRSSLETPEVASIDKSGTESIESASTFSSLYSGGNVRDIQLIMLWKKSKSNPLHGEFQRRSFHSIIAILLYLITITILTEIVFHFTIESKGVLILNNDHTLNRIFSSLEQYAHCNRNVTSPFCTALAPHNWTTEWTTLLDVHRDTVDVIAHQFRGKQTMLNTPYLAKEFSLPNISSYLEVGTDFWLLSIGIRASLSALILNQTTSWTREMNMLLQNKDVAISSTFEVSKSFLSELDANKRVASYTYAGVASGFILLVILLFTFYVWKAFRELNKERSKALELIMSIPKSTISELAYDVYSNEDDIDIEENEDQLDGKHEHEQTMAFTPLNSDNASSEMYLKEPTKTALTKLNNTKSRRGATVSIPQQEYDKKAVSYLFFLYFSIVFPMIIILIVFLTVLYPNMIISGDYVSNTYHLIHELGPISHKVMDPSLGLMNRTGVNEYLIQLEAIKGKVIELESYSISNSFQQSMGLFLRQKACLNPSNCNEPLEGIQGGFSTFIRYLIDKTTVLLKDNGTLNADELLSLQTYIIRTSNIHLGYGFQTLLEMAVDGSNSELRNTLAIFNYMHSAIIILSLAAFFAMYSFQNRMREDIKQNCLLLLMIPQTVVKKQRSLKKYIKDICSEIKRNLGS